MAVTEFGERRAGVTYLHRSCVYGVAIEAGDRIDCCVDPPGLAARSGRVLLARFKGRLVLPGGRIDSGETEREALIREAMEETGHAIEIGALLGRARQWVTRVEAGKYRDKRCGFYRIAAARRIGPPTDDRHDVSWHPAAEAIAGLSYASHRWAVELALRAI